MTIARRLFILFGMSILALVLSAGVALASDDSGGVEVGDGTTIQVGQISPNVQTTICGNAVAVGGAKADAECEGESNSNQETDDNRNTSNDDSGKDKKDKDAAEKRDRPGTDISGTTGTDISGTTGTDISGTTLLAVLPFTGLSSFAMTMVAILALVVGTLMQRMASSAPTDLNM